MVSEPVEARLIASPKLILIKRPVAGFHFEIIVRIINFTKILAMTDLSLYTKIVSLPDSLKSEVINFIEFLKTKKDTTKLKSRKRRVFGYAKGSVNIKPDFDLPLEDFKEYM